MSIAAITAVLLIAADIPLIWIARHPHAFAATAHDTRIILTRLAAWPAAFSRGLAYHRSGRARHTRAGVAVPALAAGPSLPALTAGRSTT